MDDYTVDSRSDSHKTENNKRGPKDPNDGQVVDIEDNAAVGAVSKTGAGMFSSFIPGFMKNKYTLIGIVVVIILILIYYFMWGGDSKSAKTPGKKSSKSLSSLEQQLDAEIDKINKGQESSDYSQDENE